MANPGETEPKQHSALVRIFIKVFKVYFIACAIVTAIVGTLFFKFVVGMSFVGAFVLMGLVIGAFVLFAKYAPDHWYDDGSIFDDL